MSLDMKNNRRTTKSAQGSPLLLGIIIGAFVGVAIAVGVALFLNRNSPFLNQNQTASATKETSATVAATPNISQPEFLHPDNNQIIDAIPTVSDSETPSTSEASVSRSQAMDYDFYKVLPGHHKESLASTITAKTPSTATENTKKLTKKSYLQIGAFQSEQQADNLKAKLALLGLEAQIQTKDQGDMIIHRVRIGPFTSQEALNQMRTQLSNNGINSTVVN